MQSIIEELYYGNVLPFERRAPRGGEYARIIKYLSRNEEGLLETLTEAQKVIFKSIKPIWETLGREQTGYSSQNVVKDSIPEQHCNGYIRYTMPQDYRIEQCTVSDTQT